MNVKNTVVDELFTPLRQYFQKDHLTREGVDENPPFRSELFTLDQMELHAQQLAAGHQISHEQAPEQLLKRLAKNEEMLYKVTSLLQEVIRNKKTISPAGEWLLDNFYLIEEQIRTGKRYLPRGYSKGLPKLKTGILAGFPRVYEIAIEIISHSDGHVDINSLNHFITAYQKVSYLTLGELWAIPIMLRLALLENLSRVAARIAIDRIDTSLANNWANQIIGVAENNPKDLVLTIADMARSNPPMVSAFVAEFARKIQWKGLDLTLPLTWIEQHLAGADQTIDSMVLEENQKQAADQLSVSNSINSLRFLVKMNWREFVESMSIVEQTLRQDIDGTYSLMDFFTRDHYRHQVEKIAKQSHLPENEVALIAINLAKENFQRDPGDNRKSHVGYYLIDKGAPTTERRANIRPKGYEKIEKFFHLAAGKLYILFSILVTLIIAFICFEKAHVDGVQNPWLIVISTLSLLVGSQLAVALVNWWVTLWMGPKPLPKMDFSTGIPQTSRTLVIIPTLISDPSQAEGLINDIEVRFLANRDPNLVFGLLTDFKDALAENMPGDDALIHHVKGRIEDLNRRYGQKQNDVFFLFHRPRRYNPIEKIWMGYERKRGKLAELNHLLRGKGKENFSVISGDQSIYSTIKYIITLDTDTQLPRDAAWKLVGLMSHPLNKGYYDEKKNRVTEGYGIIQPRIAISLHGATRSLYSKMNENDSGIDPYTRVTSDVYQDVFGEGSFIGKGIYDIDVFEAAVDDRFPENRILSHDLLEGSYARCGFASDVQFYEEYPSRYHVDVSRRHRWVRGDWQIANWFLPFVPAKKGNYQRNPVSALSKWKIADNLRRSSVPIAMIILLLLGWTVLPSPWFWTASVVIVVLLPSLLMSAWGAARKPKEIDLSQHLTNAIGTTHKNIQQALFTLICLPYEAIVNFDAIARTAWRVFISHKSLLQWSPSGFIQKLRENLISTYVRMAFAPIIATITFIYLISSSGTALFWALPFLVMWVLSPAIAWWVSRALPPYRARLSESQRTYLRHLSRKTWSFFEHLIGPEDQWLPPDNLQQYPIPVLAHRTSPTNMGMALLANLSAWDFGYSTTSQLIDRTTKAFESMGKMERHLGHFFNWYDTRTLKTLNPRYISTVDSGNLAGHLLTLRQGFLEIPNRKIVDARLFEGLKDSLKVLRTYSDEPAFKKIQDEIEKFSFSGLSEIRVFLKNISIQIHEYNDKNDSGEEYKWWLQALLSQLKSAEEEITMLAPWLEIRQSEQSFMELLYVTETPSLVQISQMGEALKITETPFRKESWFSDFENRISQAVKTAHERIATLEQLAVKCFEFSDMEYDFLYDKSQRLLSIGYSVDERKRDAGFYDLLASEARLGSFVAIAQGKIPQESWFALGRRLTTTKSTSVLLSWSGSMFEYLMPSLVMPTYENTLLDETCKGTVARQIEYGHQQNVPWGISESCYNVVDSNLTYQYRAFGVPGLGFKRGLGQDLVIAPYATVMSLMVNPEDAYDNLHKLKGLGYEGRYGFYESIDYTPLRLSPGQSRAVIQTFMAHHQGMSLLSLAYLLLDKPMQRRFESDAQFQTALLLLQEQVPKTTGFYTAATDTEDITPVSANTEMRIIKTADTPVPEVQLLSNGRYHVMLTNAGGGYSRWKDIAVTRWYEDSTRDHWGSFCFIKDIGTNEYWSNTHQPSLKEAKNYEAIFSQGRVEFRRRDHGIETYTEIIVSPEDDIEVRRVHLTNHSNAIRTLAITSYSEVVLTLPGADASHPAFSNLFVQTEINENQHTILCTRRPRSRDENPPWMLHLMKVNSSETGAVSFETDRNKFIGRSNNLDAPQVVSGTEKLTGSQGSVLDPIASIQYQVVLKAGETISLDMVTGISATREGTQALIDKYQDKHLRDRAFELSWTHSQVVLRQIGASESDALLFGKLAGAVIYSQPTLRANPVIIAKNQRVQSALWSYAISGDLPIVLLQISDTNNITLVKQVIKAQAYWQLKGLQVDVIILNEDPSGYRQILQDQITGLIAAGVGGNTSDKSGRIFVRAADQVPMEDRILFQAVARIILSDNKGMLADQVNIRVTSKPLMPLLTPIRLHEFPEKPFQIEKNFEFFNGLGGFSPDGKEYIITTGENHTTPLPWANVIANKNFGTIATESGLSYTWSENAHEYRLTPWMNDPVSDGGGEALYLRDEETGKFWSPMPFPASGKTPYVTRHGFGYSVFQHSEMGISSEAKVFVDVEAPLRFVVLTLRNHSFSKRKLSATGYAEWVLGALRPKSITQVITEVDSNSGAILARNAYNTEFNTRVAFFDVDESNVQYTTDRTEFLGRNGVLNNPEAMRRAKLSGKVGAGLDPCAAIQVMIDLNPEQEHTIIFRMGAGKDLNEALSIIQRFQGSKAASDSLERVHRFWDNMLGTVKVETPDPSINFLSNGWLLYQVLSCRLWGRSGFYQSGGAFGFRDQLQDVMAVMHTDSNITREQILLAASRQFREGDVQHWWHPPLGRGVRTLCSDDYLWLPFVTSRYISTTGDTQILDEQVPFLQGRLLNVDEESYYELPIISDQHSTLYDHCKRAISHGMQFGEHGLPLIGSGDWNDGMNMVGIHGKGESVWLAFFLFDVLNRFQEIARSRGDASIAVAYETQARHLSENIDAHAWDGEWYRRAYFDDGTPLGSSQNKECKIDAIAQSWAVLSEAGDEKRKFIAMKSANEYLINRDKHIIQLLDPPFDHSSLDPGYIKGYVPGVRENGGQYTHAAIWMVMAFAKLGDRKRTSELLEFLNPIRHGNSEQQIAVYKTEPYVMAADVYGVHPHTGRGGWTWYTGSAGWMYQLILESVLGIRKEGSILRFEPCIPEEWNSYTIHYRFGKSVYTLTIRMDDILESIITLDGMEQISSSLQLLDDQKDHAVEVIVSTINKNTDRPKRVVSE